MHLSRVDPSVYPITNEEAKSHLQVEHDADDMVIQGLIRAAVDDFEQATDRRLITQAVTLELDAWEVDPVEFVVPIRPVISLTSFKYYTSDGVATAWVDGTDFYTYGTDPMRIVGKNSLFVAERAYQSFQLVVSAGYGAAGNAVPRGIRTVLLELIALYYEETVGAKWTPGIERKVFSYMAMNPM